MSSESRNAVPTLATGLVSGLMFGLGLALSGMTDPHVVLGFLDPFGAWNPSLLFVMAAGVAVAFIGYRLAFRLGKPVLEGSFPQSIAGRIDRRLITGAALFGVGWGLAGYCPGPAVESLASGNLGVVVFVSAMLLGMLATRAFLAWK